MAKAEVKPVSPLVILKPEILTIKIAGIEHKINAPFTFAFWIWYFDTCGSPSNVKELQEMVEKTSLKMNDILAELTGINVSIIIEKQTEDELAESFKLICPQIVKEFAQSPFARKARMQVQAKNELTKEIVATRLTGGK